MVSCKNKCNIFFTYVSFYGKKKHNQNTFFIICYRHILESEFYPTSDFLIQFSAGQYHARLLLFSDCITRSRCATMVRHCQYWSCNCDARSLEQIKTSNDVEPKIWLFQIRKKRCKYAQRMDQGLLSGPRYSELIDRVPKRLKTITT